jgi:hypothetical protein
VVLEQRLHRSPVAVLGRFSKFQRCFVHFYQAQALELLGICAQNQMHGGRSLIRKKKTPKSQTKWKKREKDKTG